MEKPSDHHNYANGQRDHPHAARRHGSVFDPVKDGPVIYSTPSISRLLLTTLLLVLLVLTPPVMGEALVGCSLARDAGQEAGERGTARVERIAPRAVARVLAGDCPWPAGPFCPSESIADAVAPGVVPSTAAELPVTAPILTLQVAPPAPLRREIIATVGGSRAPPASPAPLFILHRALLI